jgi:lysozyme
MSDLVETLLDQEEGRSATVYPDSRGFWTISRGCLVDARVAGAGLCEAAMAAQDAHDSALARTRAAALPGFDDCNDVQRAVLVSMCFQLGALEHWPDFRAALARKDFVAAADAGMDSQWAKQTPRRAHREMGMLATGKWIEPGNVAPAEEKAA